MWAEVDKRIRRAMSAFRAPFRAVLSSVNSEPGVQLAQADALADEQLQAIELMQHYGFTSVPPAGAMALIIPVGGRTSHSVAIATELAGARVKSLEPGELAIYTDEGAFIKMRRGRVIEIECDDLNITCARMAVNASESVAVSSPLTTIDGKASVTGDAALGGALSVAGAASVGEELTVSGTAFGKHKHRVGDSTSGTPITG